MTILDDKLRELPLYPIFDVYMPLAPEQVRAVEEACGKPLPKDLAVLFGERGCSGFRHLATVELHQSATPIAHILGGGHSSYSVLNVLGDLIDEVAECIPFAGDEFGNYYVYRVSEPERGVWYWRHDLSDPENPRHLCSTLDEFVAAIKV